MTYGESILDKCLLYGANIVNFKETEINNLQTIENSGDRTVVLNLFLAATQNLLQTDHGKPDPHKKKVCN